MKTYKAKSSVKRAVVKASGKEVFEAGTVEMTEDGTKEFYFVPKAVELDKPLSKEMVDIIDKVVDKAFEEENKKPESKSKRVYDNKSTCESPCKIVWDVAEEFGVDAKRKEVLAECERRGVTFYTARTQYQKYKEALRGDVK